MAKNSPPPFIALGLIFTAALIVSAISCSTEPQTFKLHVAFGPIGEISTYKFLADEVGKVYVNGELSEDFDMKVEGDIYYTVKDTLPGGGALVLEKNVWSWDEPADDSGQVKRETKEYAYELQMHPTGKVLALKMMERPSERWEEYVRSYARQANPIYPDQKIAPGYSWVQTVPVELPDGTVDTSVMTFRFKGTARKMGYNCGIVEYKGEIILPLFPDPQDTLELVGVDRMEINGITCQAIEEGMIVTTDECRRVARDREFIREGKPIKRRAEFESAVKVELVSIEGGGGG